jgi:hypothetical protein
VSKIYIKIGHDMDPKSAPNFSPASRVAESSTFFWSIFSPKKEIKKTASREKIAARIVSLFELRG